MPLLLLLSLGATRLGLVDQVVGSKGSLRINVHINGPPVPWLAGLKQLFSSFHGRHLLPKPRATA